MQLHLSSYRNGGQRNRRRFNISIPRASRIPLAEDRLRARLPCLPHFFLKPSHDLACGFLTQRRWPTRWPKHQLLTPTRRQAHKLIRPAGRIWPGTVGLHDPIADHLHFVARVCGNPRLGRSPELRALEFPRTNKRLVQFGDLCISQLSWWRATRRHHDQHRQQRAPADSPNRSAHFAPHILLVDFGRKIML